MTLRDDRTPEQKKTHTWIVLATDKVLSGWGLATGGPSYAGWACQYEYLPKVQFWVENRSDMIRVCIVSGSYRPPSGPGDCHIYVVTEDHPALQ